MKKPLLIGIAGGSASGKSSIAKKIHNYFKNSNSVYILKQDDYYNDQSNMCMEERVKVNYDHPLAFDNDLLIKQVSELKEGKVIEKPTYDFVEYTRKNETELVEPTEVIIVEGVLIFDCKELRDLFDLKVYVDTDSDIRLIRRIRRDVNERGRSLESIFEQYLNTVKEMYTCFVEPTKRYADIIIPRGVENVKAIDLIITKITSILS